MEETFYAVRDVLHPSISVAGKISPCNYTSYIVYVCTFTYSDPPLDPLNLPEGEWVCQGCRPPPAHLSDHSNSVFRPLLMQCYSENPLVFSLPEELMNVVAVRGW